MKDAKALISIHSDGFVEGACCSLSLESKAFKSEALADGCTVQVVDREFAKRVLFENINDVFFDA